MFILSHTLPHIPFLCMTLRCQIYCELEVITIYFPSELGIKNFFLKKVVSADPQFVHATERVTCEKLQGC